MNSISITINWPTGTDSAAFFQSGESPQSGSTGTAYFSMSVLDNQTTHNYNKDVGLAVNKRDGKIVYVLPGQWISCYRFINGWSYVGEFILPSADTIVTL